MPISERQRLVREGVERVRQMEADPAFQHVDDGVKTESLAEGLAVLAAYARDVGEDEGVLAEIMVRTAAPDRDTLLEARRVMAALGYREIADVLKGRARSAPRRISSWERIKARCREKAAISSGKRATRH